MVELGRVSRSSFYRFDGEAGAVRNQAMDLRDAVQRIALEMPSTAGRALRPSCAAGGGG
jgi:hypothetical protein